MDLSLDSLRELFENLLGNTGGRRGREREQARQAESGEGPGNAGGVGERGQQPPIDGQGQPDGAQAGDGSIPGDSAGGGAGGGGAGGDGGQAGAEGSATAGAAGGNQAGPAFDQERPDPEELDDDEVVDDLYHRIETLEEELERNGNQLGSIRDAQESVSSDIEEVNDTVRRLLGVYDKLTQPVNPFSGAGEEAEGFGVFGENHHEGFGLEDSNDRSSDGVSFEDLRAAVEEGDGSREARRIPFEDEIDDAAEPTAGGAGSGDGDADSSVEVQATDSADATNEGPSNGAEDEADATKADESPTAASDDDVTLATLADSYATDVLIFEWLTEMVRTGGPSATLRAISYYHEIGWIDEDVRTHLEAVLSGPDLDIHVDPERTPEELTAADHADSYEYIMKLAEVHEARAEVTG
ncbi:FlaD/FlaE family flagellar protein [Halovivax limisalsi]|uniref:FlaD/FlaE family flagellar protein n=1 Tax=Halovivax limisalsi TaxID=1453760 RepID=UPI001FFD7F9B|nr:FlaD/FlaE family flagellar protein [Halovivax limisalsi]